MQIYSIFSSMVTFSLLLPLYLSLKPGMRLSNDSYIDGIITISQSSIARLNSSWHIQPKYLILSLSTSLRLYKMNTHNFHLLYDLLYRSTHCPFFMWSLDGQSTLITLSSFTRTSLSCFVIPLKYSLLK